MSNYQAVFKRVEKKYLLDEHTRMEFLAAISPYIRPDRFGPATLFNIYYDTEDYRFIRASIEKPDYKEKLRMRSYSLPTCGSQVFIELKKKMDGTVYKRRMALPYEDALSYLSNRGSGAATDQIEKEINWFLHSYPLLPKAFISYDRDPWHGIDDPGLRITFDRNILFRSCNLELAAGNFGKQVLDPQLTLMEIKMSGGMPLWLSSTLNEMGIFPVSFSKYGNGYKQFIATQIFGSQGGGLIA